MGTVLCLTCETKLLVFNLEGICHIIHLSLLLKLWNTLVGGTWEVIF